MSLKLLLFLLPAVAFVAKMSVASAAEISIGEFLRTAWEKGPLVRGEALQNEASNQFVSAARGKWLPHVSLDAVDSTGFAAANSGLQVEGLMGSPFRSGLAGGVVVEQTIYDFGRIQSAIAGSKADMSLRRSRLAENKYHFLTSVGQIYLACSRARLLQETAGELMSWAEINLKETAKFTRTGQRSIVDNSLVQAEVNALKLELDQLDRYQTSLTEQMALYGASAGCKDLAQAWQLQVGNELKVEEPSLLLAQAELEMSKASLESSKAAQLPTLKVMGSLGSMEQSRVVQVQDYSAGVGLVFPIWNGGEDARKEQAWKSQAEYQKENLQAAQLEFSAHMKNLSDEFAREQSALKVEESDLAQVRKTMRIASQRYHNLEGPLIDVREAFKQLRQMEVERIQTLYRLGSVQLTLALLLKK
jgi:outer membrane protein TolC